MCTLQFKKKACLTNKEKQQIGPNVTNATNYNSFEKILLDPAFQQNTEHFKENISDSQHFMSREGIYIFKYIYFYFQVASQGLEMSGWRGLIF